MTHGITANFGSPLKPPSWGGLSLGLSATAATPALHAMADTAATIGIPVIQIGLLLTSVILIVWGQREDMKKHKKMLREVLSDLHSEWTTQRIHEYRMMHRQQRIIRQKRASKYRI